MGDAAGGERGDADTHRVMLRGERRYPQGDAVCGGGWGGSADTHSVPPPFVGCRGGGAVVLSAREGRVERDLQGEISISLFPMGRRGPPVGLRDPPDPPLPPGGTRAAEDAMLPEADGAFPEPEKLTPP